MIEINPGSILISHPFLKDENFTRTVVVMCEYTDDGGVGFVLNRPYEHTLKDVIDGIQSKTDFTVYYGGPVQPETLHFIHRCPELINGGADLGDGIYWGGSFEEVLIRINKNEIDAKDIRFFLGYSGWDFEQLQDEIKEDTWITSSVEQPLIFTDEHKNIWSDALKSLGGTYAQMINFPIDPQLN